MNTKGRIQFSTGEQIAAAAHLLIRLRLSIFLCTRDVCRCSARSAAAFSAVTLQHGHGAEVPCADHSHHSQRTAGTFSIDIPYIDRAVLESFADDECGPRHSASHGRCDGVHRVLMESSLWQQMSGQGNKFTYGLHTVQAHVYRTMQPCPTQPACTQLRHCACVTPTANKRHADDNQRSLLHQQHSFA
jgi:hypothetical protein